MKHTYFLSIIFMLVVPILSNHTDTVSADSYPPCVAEKPELIERCAEIEQRILSSTLRIEIDLWLLEDKDQSRYRSISSKGHGTVINGNHLLTHNHFQLPAHEIPVNDDDGQLATLTLLRADGRRLWRGHLAEIKVAFQASESLLLEFAAENSRPFFEALGVPALDFSVPTLSSIAPGTAVAQINWDKQQAFVQWTQITAVDTTGDTPIVRLADCIVTGASGGGMFVDGFHLGNNWLLQKSCDGTTPHGADYRSTVALNTFDLLSATN
ncbi:MAG: hypothetical protein R3293_15405 [Candidatus Promineifilaceae bacterium]|nr:hypothetical protein [Candidatus Promineifilaceae bacterium]